MYSSDYLPQSPTVGGNQRVQWRELPTEIEGWESLSRAMAPLRTASYNRRTPCGCQLSSKRS